MINVRDCLGGAIEAAALDKRRLPDVTIDPARIRVVMINEVVPADPDEDFYGVRAREGYLKTVLPLFRQAGAEVNGIGDILDRGIHLTNAVKTPKSGYHIDNEILKAQMPLLEKELALFGRLTAIMLMGDVAKKLFNRMAKKQSGKNAISAGATYKQRNQAFYYDGVRIFPSYIMTGENILIEKSKFAMAADDIRRMLALL